MFFPSKQEAVKLAESSNIIPISMEMYADMETPISLFKRFEEREYCFLLESVEGGEKWARYSIIGKDPFLILKNEQGRTYVEKGTVRQEYKGNPVEILKNLVNSYKAAEVKGLPRFSGGAVGFFGYDLIRYYENLPDIPPDDLGLPDCHFIFVNEVIVFDHLMQKIIIIVNMDASGDTERNYHSTVQRIKDIYNEIVSSRWKLEQHKPVLGFEKSMEIKYTANVSTKEYCSRVSKAREYIKNGDIFQVVLSQRLEAENDRKPLDVYRVLRVINPSPYMYYLKFGNYTIAGSSPEMLLRVEGGKAETCPIAGTRRRGESPLEDERLEKELLGDEKERAEHTMLVDLGRNDIGKVSKFGTVQVKNYMHVERYSHVMHLVSNVEGELKENVSAFDALMSVLPAGTLSGAPKIRAMQIIDELENTKRGPYGGAIGYIGFNGTLDTCITIRTVIFRGNKAYIQAGAGIVADSIPQKEYEECMNKAGALIRALEEAGEMI